MAKITTVGPTETLIERELYRLSDDRKAKVLTAGAEVLVEAQKRSIEDQGLVDTGTLRDSIQADNLQLTADGGSIDITPVGTYADRKSKTRTATVAAIWEYGTSRLPARPFVRTANEQSRDAVAKAMAEAKSAD